MKESLGTLVENLAKDGKGEFPTLTSYYGDEQQIQLLLRKGVYPYDYMDHECRFEETSLSPSDAFCNKLTDSHISDDDYQHAQKVWKTFNMNALADYHDLYLQSDIMLLTDIFENFGNTCMTSYSLDPAHYYTVSGLSWDAMLKKTGANL